MDEKRSARILGGIAFTIVFVIFAIVSCKVAVHSSDLENFDPVGINDYYGYDRERYLINHGREDELSSSKTVDSEEPVPVSEEPVIEEIIEPAVTEEPLPAAPDPESPAGRASALGLPTPPDIDINSWELMLVNVNYNLGSEYAPGDTAFFAKNVAAGDAYFVQSQPDTQDWNNCQVDARIADALQAMAQGCVAAGYPCYLSSGYRSYNEQNYLLNEKLKSYDYATAVTIVAVPGTSEHQTGLVCDITDRYYEGNKNSSLAETDTYKWLAANCADYGFIVRYPADKSGSADSITHVIYEPWHFRYVGVDASHYMMENNLCLEEFWDLYYPGTSAGTALFMSDFVTKAGT